MGREVNSCSRLSGQVRSRPPVEGVGATDDELATRARNAAGVIFFVNGAVFASWASRIPAVVSGMHLNSTQFGLALMGLAAATPIAMPVCGALVGRWGSRPVTRAVVVANCLALPLPALAPNVWALTAGLVLLGASNGSLVVAQNAQAVAIERVRRRTTVTGLHGLLSLGWVGGSLAGAAAATAGLGPSTHLIGAGAALLGPGLWACGRLLPATTDRASQMVGFPRLSSKLGALAAASFCCLLAEGCALDWSAIYLSGALNGGEGLAALGPGAFAVTMTVGRLFGNGVILLVGAARVVRAGAGVAAVGLVVAATAPAQGAGLVGFALLGAGLSPVFPVLLSAAGAGRSGPAAPHIAAVATAGYLGLFAGPGLIGALAEVTGLRVALGSVVLAPAVISFASFHIGPAGPPPTRRESSCLT